MIYFIIGFIGYFLVRYRLKISEFTRRSFMRNEERASQKRLRTHVTFFEIEEVWPEPEAEKKKAS